MEVGEGEGGWGEGEGGGVSVKIVSARGQIVVLLCAPQ